MSKKIEWKVAALAAMVLASNVAVAGISQQSLQASKDSFGSLSQAAEVLASGSVKFSKAGYDLSKDAVIGTIALGGASIKSTSEKSESAAKKVSEATKASVKSTSNAASAAGEFVVEKVESAASASGRSIKVTLKSIYDNTLIVGTWSYNSTSTVGKAMLESAAALFIVGKTVVIATSQSGVVLVTDSANGVAQVLDGQIKNGSSTIIASFSNASKAFGSTMVQGLEKKK